MMFRDPSGMSSEMALVSDAEEINYDVRSQIVFVHFYREADPLVPGIDKTIGVVLWTRVAAGDGGFGGGKNNGIVSMPGIGSNSGIGAKPFYGRNDYTPYDLKPLKYNNNINDNYANSERIHDQIKDLTETNEITFGTVLDFYEIRQGKILKKLKDGTKVSYVSSYRRVRFYSQKNLNSNIKWIKGGQNVMFAVSLFASGFSAIDNFENGRIEEGTEDILDAGASTAAFIIGGIPGLTIGLGYFVLKPVLKPMIMQELFPSTPLHFPGNQGTPMMPADKTKAIIRFRRWIW